MCSSFKSLVPAALKNIPLLSGHVQTSAVEHSSKVSQTFHRRDVSGCFTTHKHTRACAHLYVALHPHRSLSTHRYTNIYAGTLQKADVASVGSAAFRSIKLLIDFKLIRVIVLGVHSDL